MIDTSVYFRKIPYRECPIFGMRGCFLDIRANFGPLQFEIGFDPFYLFYSKTPPI